MFFITNTFNINNSLFTKALLLILHLLLQLLTI